MANLDMPDHFNNTDDILDIFEDLNVRPHLQSTVVPAEYDNDFFSEDKGNKTYIISELDEDGIVAQWTNVLQAFEAEKVSSLTIHKIMEIAVNAISVEDNTRLLRWNARPASVISGISELSDTRLMTGKMANSIKKKVIDEDDYTVNFRGRDDGEDDATDDEELDEDSASIKAKAAGYICLCLMRLMKKDPDMFMRGISSIKRSFTQFYETSSATVLNFDFKIGSIYAIADGLRSNVRLGQTMVYHVATGMKGLNRLSKSYHLMRFSFCQHVELMGMHAYKLFYELDNVFHDRLPTNVFLSWLTTDSTVKATLLISQLIKHYDNENTTDEYLWQYARYLNNGYFYDLHTARCRSLVCILAYLSDSQIKKKGDDRQQGSMDLAELKKMTKADKEQAIEYAKAFEEQYSKLVATSKIMNRVQRDVQKKRGLPADHAPTKRQKVERANPEADPMDQDNYSFPPPPSAPPSGTGNTSGYTDPRNSGRGRSFFTDDVTERDRERSPRATDGAPPSTDFQ